MDLTNGMEVALVNMYIEKRAEHYKSGGMCTQVGQHAMQKRCKRWQNAMCWQGRM